MAKTPRRTRNPVAKAVRTERFRTRRVAAAKGKGAYRRRPKHGGRTPPEGGHDGR